MKNFFFSLLFLGALSGFACAQGSYATAPPITINQSGAPIPNALTTVCVSNPGTGACPSLVTTYTDVTLSTPCSGTLQPLNNYLNPTVGTGCSNPGLGDGLGNIVVYAASGFYWCQYSGPSITTYVQPCNFPLQASANTLSIPNSTNATLCNAFSKIDQTAGSGTLGKATATTGGETLFLGIVTSGCGGSGTANIQYAGFAFVVFDSSSPTVGDAVGINNSGVATDLGSANPTTTAAIVGSIQLFPNGTVPSGCTVAPGCRVFLTLGGGGGGGTPNAVVTNPAITATNNIQSTSATAQPLTTNCPASAATTFPCLQVKDNAGNQVLAGLQGGTVLVGKAGGTVALASQTASNSDFNGTLTMSSGTGTYSFSGTYAVHPICTASDETSISAVKVTYTGVASVTFTTSGSTDVIDYHCFGRT